ncbi:DUF692 domain-containing protein [Minwuia thermotolerans]|uniref:UPF0276 protein CVT23_13610 n=1 Tax=Minwuia thermotolerans TaxID=2056226 RepID=A0A2M9G076_9PROT|nr:DUF692 domain-containing protein [Minwuia thermotolerans]PJK29120.1 hypothetical protein CVT23_13610 [Minwuia thermotolerans]
MNPPASSLPPTAGFGLRHPHVLQVIDRPPAVDWVEVHTENYMYPGGPRLRQLEAVRERFDLSLHGVGLSLGSVDEPDRDHLKRIRALADRFRPAAISDHIAWVRAPKAAGGASLNDLLPLPCTEEALETLARNIAIFQDALGRRVMVENPSMYLEFAGAEMDHAEFVAETVRRAGCGLLLDVNNIHVSARNLGFDASDYLDRMPFEAVGEIHLAGHAERETPGGTLLIDDHGSRVRDEVWALYERALDRLGAVPTLIEWDTCIPDLRVILAETAKAQRRMDALAGPRRATA